MSTLTAIAGIAGGISSVTAVAGFVVPDHAVKLPPYTPAPGAWDDNAVTLAWLGHASVLINFYGVRVLTDPALFPRIGVGAWVTTLGPLRLTSCALPPAQLPEIDLVVVSHAHFDHLDTRSLGALRGRPAVVAAAATSDLLPRKRFRSIRELRWDDAVRIETARGDIEVRAIQVKHWGARLGRDTYRGYNGYVLRREGARAALRRRHRVHAAVGVASPARPPSTPPSCRSARTIRGSTITATRSRRWRWPMRRAPVCSCRCITRHFG